MDYRLLKPQTRQNVYNVKGQCKKCLSILCINQQVKHIQLQHLISSKVKCTKIKIISSGKVSCISIVEKYIVPSRNKFESKQLLFEFREMFSSISVNMEFTPYTTHGSLNHTYNMTLSKLVFIICVCIRRQRFILRRYKFMGKCSR